MSAMSGSEEDGMPRPIGAANDDEADDLRVTDRQDIPAVAEGKNGASEAPAAADKDDEKPSRKRPKFSENSLVSNKGLLKIYSEFPGRCKYKGKGKEADFLRRLMVAYKEWGFQLFPGLAFEDLANRTEKLGGKARVRELMSELRDKERDRFVEAKYGRSAVEVVRSSQAAKAAAEEAEKRERQEDKESANDRYMDVDSAEDEAFGEHERQAEAGESGAADKHSAVTAQIRDRMEANRRLALERLRLRKEEASRGESMPANTGSGEVDKDEPKDVTRADGGTKNVLAGGCEDDEHDEAALNDVHTSAHSPNDTDEMVGESLLRSTEDVLGNGVRDPTAGIPPRGGGWDRGILTGAPHQPESCQEEAASIAGRTESGAETPPSAAIKEASPANVDAESVAGTCQHSALGESEASGSPAPSFRQTNVRSHMAA